jgi:hypothetical protein
MPVPMNADGQAKKQNKQKCQKIEKRGQIIIDH